MTRKAPAIHTQMLNANSTISLPPSSDPRRLKKTTSTFFFSCPRALFEDTRPIFISVTADPHPCFAGNIHRRWKTRVFERRHVGSRSHHIDVGHVVVGAGRRRGSAKRTC